MYKTHNIMFPTKDINALDNGHTRAPSLQVDNIEDVHNQSRQIQCNRYSFD